MAESPISKPGSTQGSTPIANHARKDKHCPFCNQAFTSSSLGRHLDLYIRENNPKASDGIHDPSKIRSIRGHITRRQARNSSGRRGSSTFSQSKQSSQGSPPPSTLNQTNGLSVSKGRTLLNEAGWEATGVIRNIPSPMKDGPQKIEPRRDVSKRYQVKSAIERKQKMTEVTDEARAAELALKEVLESMKAADSQVHPHSPFDFNPFAFTFPALTLRCLSAPPTLFSAHSFPTASSWSLDPPAQMQYESLRRYVQDQFSSWRRNRAASRRMAASSGDASMSGYDSINDEDLNSNAHGQQEEHHVQKHVEEAFNHWKVLPEKQRSDHWRLEALRAYARSEERRIETEAKLQLALQEAQNLRMQVEKLSNCQQPREFLLFPPSNIPINKDVINTLKSDSTNDLGNWDFDQLVSKWKAVIASSRRANTGIAGQRKLTESHPPMPIATPDTGSSLAMNGTFHSDNNDAEHEFEDEELQDAEAEADGTIESSRAPQTMLSQNLGAQTFEPHGEVMGMGSLPDQHHVNTGEFMGSRMLMNLGSADFTNMKGSNGVGLSG